MTVGFIEPYISTKCKFTMSRFHSIIMNSLIRFSSSFADFHMKQTKHRSKSAHASHAYATGSFAKIRVLTLVGYTTFYFAAPILPNRMTLFHIL